MRQFWDVARREDVLLAVDVVLALTLLAVGQTEVRTDPVDGYTAGPLWVNTAACALTTLPLAVRRRWPSAAFLVPVGTHGVADALVPHAVYFWSTGVPMAVLTLTLTRQVGATWARWAWLLVVGVLVLDAVRVPAARDLIGWISMALLFAGVSWAGRALRTNAERAALMAETVAALAEEQQRQERLAALAERSLILDEVEDVLTHVMGEMVVQVGATRVELEAAGLPVPDQLLAAETAGRRALGELATGLGVGPDRGPLPSLADLPALAEQSSSAGVATTCRVVVDPTSLPANLQVTVYRMVQESLTNAVKHAGGATATVSVVAADGELRVVVRDEGGAEPSLQFPLSGHGLPGMRERAAVFGGVVAAGPTPTGFCVDARFPLRRGRVARAMAGADDDEQSARNAPAREGAL